MDIKHETKTTTANIGLAIWRLKCFYEKFVQGSTAVILLNFCAKNPPHRQAVNRCLLYAEKFRKKFFLVYLRKNYECFNFVVFS
ncbi:hypothetical protein, partial [Flavobacterium croceum]|uniref:hypothetical protein n=1 Tax=Flavobacterium croceum TaxID=370975 RepID=UPI000CDA2D48